MSEISLSHLRQLRGRAGALLDKLQMDLQPFVKDDGTFRRKPDSSSAKGDINVTTTCSCLMSLALTNKFETFYKSALKDKYGSVFPNGADALFTAVAKAPWMSSGLTANNAFTTTLVIRTLGFLEEEKLFGVNSQDDKSVQKIAMKTWELDLGIANVLALVTSLTSDPSSFLWLSLSDKTRDLLNVHKGATGLDPESQKKLKKALTVDLRNIIQSGWIYEGHRFDKASPETKEKLAGKPTGYPLAEVNYWLLVDQYPDAFLKPKERSMIDIAKLMASDADNFSINEYPPSAAVIYWFVDGITRAEINLDPPQWNVLCTWAAKEFNHQRSLVVAEHDAMMDPVSMGMAACLCARLRSTANKEHLATLPSSVELEQSIRELFKQQTKSGIWHKYFPLFHYQDAGSNFCFTFELLEAVLHEFGSTDNILLVDPLFFNGLKRAVAWCEKNRQDASEEYGGWNSGGYIETLQKGQPESWATAVVHMFLSELKTALSQRIQREVLGKYQVRFPKPKAVVPESKEKAAISKLLDIEIFLPGGSALLSDLLWTHIIGHYKDQDELSLRRNPAQKSQPLSVLLFGPPGTSKTEVTNAIASDLNWPLVELTPSNFVRDSLANVYVQAEEIFDDLMDLAGVVIFFDEMDALVQTREGEARLDVASQFLTTTMLPKLTHLHDCRQAVFFMATNFQDQFDAAIKRAGRFDLLLCMGPPKLDEKLNRLHAAFAGENLDDESKIKKARDQGTAAGNTIREYLKDKSELQTQLGLYTFGEFKSFLKKFGNSQDIADKLATAGKEKFIAELETYTNYVTLRLADVEELLKHFHRKHFEELITEKFTLQELKEAKIRITPIVRYLCDQKESKEQY